MRGEPVAKLVWRVKLVAELEPGVVTETELARIERDAQAGLAELGLQLDEAKRLTAGLQARLVPAPVAASGECRRAWRACGRALGSKGHYGATFRSLFGEVPVRVRRRLACPCRGACEAKSFTVLDLGKGVLAPELAYVTARYAALAPFGKVAALLSELLPLGGAQHASTVRNRTLRVGTQVVRAHAAEAANRPAAPATNPVVVGLDGGYVRNRHRAEGRRFEVIAGKVIQADGNQHRFAFPRTGPIATTEAFRAALAAAGVGADNARDGAVRRRRWAVAAAARSAAGGHGCPRLVARRGAFRTRPAGGPKPRRGHGRRVPGRSGGSRFGAREVAPVARAPARVPAQACGPVPLGGTRGHARGGRHRQAAPARDRPARLPRAQRGGAGPLRRPAPARRTDRDLVRGERGGRDHRLAHGQGAADALEQADGAALPRRAHGRAERHARARLPPSPSRLPARQRRPQADSSGGVITSHDLAWSPGCLGFERHGRGPSVREGAVVLHRPAPDANRPIRATRCRDVIERMMSNVLRWK